MTTLKPKSLGPSPEVKYVTYTSTFACMSESEIIEELMDLLEQYRSKKWYQSKGRIVDRIIFYLGRLKDKE